MNRGEVVKTLLNRAKIQPGFTTLGRFLSFKLLSITILLEYHLEHTTPLFWFYFWNIFLIIFNSNWHLSKFLQKIISASSFSLIQYGRNWRKKIPNFSELIILDYCWRNKSYCSITFWRTSIISWNTQCLLNFQYHPFLMGFTQQYLVSILHAIIDFHWLLVKK